MKMRFFALIFLIIYSIIPAQNKTPLTPEKMYELSSVNSGRISYNGEKLLFVKTNYSFEKNKYISQLYIKDIYRKTLPFKISFKDSSCSNTSWTPLENTISYLSDTEGKSQIFLVNLKTQESVKLTNHSGSIKTYTWAGKDKLFYLADESPFESSAKATDQNEGYFYEEDKRILSLWKYDIVKKQQQRLTEKNLSVRTFKFQNNGGNLIAFTAAPSGLPSDENKTEIYTIDIETLVVSRLTFNNIMEKQINWAGDGSFITFISNANKFLEPYYQESIFKLDLKNGTVTDLLPDFGYQVIDHQLDWKRNKIYFTANKGVTQQLFSYDLSNNKVVQHTSIKGVIKAFTLYTPKNKIVAQIADPENPDDFYLFFPGKWNKLRLTFSNPQLNKYILGQYKTFFWKSTDSKEIEGILIYPPKYNPRKKYPLIVQLHGGPNASYQLNFGFSWTDYPNYLASKDYIIFQPNYRGSTGYGDDFMRGIIGDLFSAGYNDIMSGVDFLIKNGIADENKLGIMGYSAGGHFTNWIITHTNRFKYAISGSGAANLLSFYAQNEVPYLREIWMNSIPYDNLDKWIKQSPISFVNKVKTPTFFYCGDKDTRVPYTQALEMWRGLKRYNIPTRFYVLTGVGHDVADVKQRITKMNYEIEWIDKWMNN